MPADVGLDLGGIVKGWTCDRAAERALAVGLPWVLVDAGGDLRILGDALSLTPQPPQWQPLAARTAQAATSPVPAAATP